MIASLLPGLRDLRTPLAVGYLWIVVLWLIASRWVPRSVQQATGPIRALYELGTFLGSAVVLAALSFVAYLIGSILSRQQTKYMGRIVRPIPETGLGFYLARFGIGRGGKELFVQLVVFVAGPIRDADSPPRIDGSDHGEVLGSRYHKVQKFEESWGLIAEPNPDDERAHGEYLIELTQDYARAIVGELHLVGIQLQAKNRDFWDTYDRKLAEAQFRQSIVLPLALIFALLAALSGHAWWLLFLVVPIALYIFSRRYYLEAASTLVQAVVLKMVEPPVLEKLQEVVAKKREDEAKKQEEEAKKPLAGEISHPAKIGS